jgi:hypothetical protein
MSHNENRSRTTTTTAEPMAVTNARAPIWKPTPDSTADATITRFIDMAPTDH